MITPAISNDEVPKEAISPARMFQQQVAMYYANILHGCHVRKEPMAYTFPLILAGHTLDSSQLQPYLHSRLATKLAMTDDTDLHFVYARIVRDNSGDDDKQSKVEIFLRIGASIITR